MRNKTKLHLKVIFDVSVQINIFFLLNYRHIKTAKFFLQVNSKAFFFFKFILLVVHNSHRFQFLTLDTITILNTQ